MEGSGPLSSAPTPSNPGSDAPIGARWAGIDVGGTKCLAVVVDSAGRVIERHRRSTPRGGEQLVEAIVELVGALGPVDSVGVGVAGLVTDEGVVRAAPNLAGVRELALGAQVGDRLGRRVVVDNDNTTAAVAEMRIGAGVGVDDMIYVGLGTGIGGALVAGGELCRGHHGFAGEIGHMVIVVDGQECACGQRGCWEAYASGTALTRQARAAARSGAFDSGSTEPEEMSSESLVAAARGGQTPARAVVDAYARWVALGLVNLINLADPELVVLGGGLVDAADVLVDPVRVEVDALLFGAGSRPRPRIEAARSGSDAAAIGAAFMGAEGAG